MDQIRRQADGRETGGLSCRAAGRLNPRFHRADRSIALAGRESRPLFQDANRALCHFEKEHELVRSDGSLLLGLLAFFRGDAVANRAGVMAIEGFFNRHGEWRNPGIGHEHPCPGEGLHHRPMPAARGQKGHESENLTEAEEATMHDHHELREGSGEVNGEKWTGEIWP